MKEYFNKTFCLEVEGDYACFTRPEMKVERVSYDVITPSAARGIFEAIFWKPAIRWEISKIEVLKPIRWTSVRKNEVGSLMSPRTHEIFIEDKRQQRAGLFLKDVKYRLHAELHFINIKERKSCQIPVSKALISSEEHEDLLKNENPAKYNGMFERRARKGQCFNQPYFGCREFSCRFRFIENLDEEEAPIEETRDLGFMLYDLDFSDVMNPLPAFFRPVLNNGVIKVPSWESKEVFW